MKRFIMIFLLFIFFSTSVLSEEKMIIINEFNEIVNFDRFGNSNKTNQYNIYNNKKLVNTIYPIDHISNLNKTKEVKIIDGIKIKINNNLIFKPDEIKPVKVEFFNNKFVKYIKDRKKNIKKNQIKKIKRKISRFPKNFIFYKGIIKL